MKKQSNKLQNYLCKEKIINSLKLTGAALALTFFSCQSDSEILDLESSSSNNLSSNSVELGISSYSASGAHASYPASNAFDGSTSTRWTSNGIGEYLDIDLGEDNTVDYVMLAHYNGSSRTYNFKVYTKSSSSSSFTQVGSKSNDSSNELQTYDVTNSTARYIRIESNGNTSNNWSDITEVEIWGTGDTGSDTTPDNSSSGSTPYSVLGSVISDWKITYPVDEDGNDSSNADDCDDRNKDAHEQRDLTGTISSPYSDYFYVSGDEVVFKAHVGGATTSGSSYPRSEFRQLVGGDDNYWSMDDYQYLEVRVRATNLPETKPEVSMVQIHGPDDEPLRVEYREDSQGLHVVQNEDTTETYVLDYELGQQLFVTVTVNDGDITLYILNEDTGKDYEDTWEAEDSTGYFKVGCYTQSNNNLETCKPGEGYDNQDADEYGEVRIKDLKLTETY